ncbi:MAG TPA: OB-fold nucleic acid binding domain-containing protein, partial [Chitinophagales bacterium]
MSQHLSEQEILRREKKVELEKMGVNPYPPELFEVTHAAEEILKKFDAENVLPELQDVGVAGRVMSIRLMGKAAFAVLQDASGKIQLYIGRDAICPTDDKTLFDEVFKRLLDIGDIIGVRGYVFKTKTGETSIHVSSFTLLSKSLKPLPIVKEKDGEVFDAFSDPEQRYRQRYVDLIVNPTVKETFLKRTKLVKTIRDFLDNHGALEVDTPVLQNIPGGAAAKPFITHHNAL